VNLVIIIAVDLFFEDRPRFIDGGEFLNGAGSDNTVL